MKSKSVVLIGGTFNPFTNAHLAMSHTVRSLLPDADIIYVPSNMDYIAKWKKLPGSRAFNGRARAGLILESIRETDNCFVTEVESTGQLSGKTYDTVQSFKGRYDKIFICIGSDKLYEIGKWYKAEELMRETKVIVLTRGEKLKDCDSEFVKKHINQFIELEFNFPGISSSMIRKLYEEGNMEEIRKNVPGPVYQYLKEVKNAF